MSTTKTRALDLSKGNDRAFVHLLINALLVSVINFTVWFAVTFWVFLETKSVLATGMVAGIFLVTTALSGIWFGSLVDHHRKKTVMQTSSLVSLAFYAVAFTLYQLTPEQTFTNPASVMLWVFIVLSMFGVIAGNIRSIALMTLVTVLIPEDRRDRANGLGHPVLGSSFLVTSVISGLAVAAGGCSTCCCWGWSWQDLSVGHLALMRSPGPPNRAASQGAESTDRKPKPNKVDIRGTLRVVRGVPGPLALIAFACFNNFLGGAFMALMDAYGLYLMSVQTWGLLWGALSTGFIIGGLAVAKTGLGKNPVRLLLLVNVVFWSVTCVFPLRPSVILLAAGMAIYMLLGPYAEASEQTILQRVVPYQRQGRVFGFAQSVEMAASPLTAFLHWADHTADIHPVHDDRCGRRTDRRLVRYRPRPWYRAGLRPDRDRRPCCDDPRAIQSALSSAKHPDVNEPSRPHRKRSS